MSAVRVMVDGRPDWRVIDDGAVGRVSYSRLGIKGGAVQGAYVVGRSGKPRTEDRRTTHAKRLFVEAPVRKNPDNGAVEAPITEVQT